MNSTWSCVILNLNGLKEQIEEHCKNWISKFSKLLLENTIEFIEGFYDYMSGNSRR